MKKKLGALLFSFLLAVLLAGCDEVLSVVTTGKDGEKVVRNYVLMMGDTVADEGSSIKSWQDIGIFEDDFVEMDGLLFKIVDKKEKIVVLGDEDDALEIRFVDDGYKYKVFASMD